MEEVTTSRLIPVQSPKVLTGSAFPPDYSFFQPVSDYADTVVADRNISGLDE